MIGKAKSQYELEIRDELVQHFTRTLQNRLTNVNPAFRFVRIETPIFGDGKLRENTVSAAHSECREMLSRKQRLPVVVWQHGKVFQPNEVYIAEYVILYSKTTATVYKPIVIQACVAMIERHCDDVTVHGDTISSALTGDPLVKITDRDFWGGNTIEIVINLDSCVKACIKREKDEPQIHARWLT